MTTVNICNRFKELVPVWHLHFRPLSQLIVCIGLGALGLASISFLTVFTNLEQVPLCTTLQVLQHNEGLERMWYLVSTYCDTKPTNKSYIVQD